MWEDKQVRQTRGLLLPQANVNMLNAAVEPQIFSSTFGDRQNCTHPKVTATCAVQRSGLLTGRRAMLTVSRSSALPLIEA